MGLFGPFTDAGKRMQAIENAIAKQEYDGARDMLVKFEDRIEKGCYDWSSKESRRAQAKVLRDKLTKSEGLYLLRKRVDDFDLNLAQKVLDSLKSAKLLDKKEIADLEALTNSITESGLLSRLKGCSLNERRLLTEKFSQLYRNSRERSSVIENLVVEEFSNLINSVNGNIFYCDLRLLVHNLNRTLENYSGEGINLSKVVPIDEAVKKVEDYVKEIKVKKLVEEQIKEGDLVSVTGFVSSTDWDENYIKQRMTNIPKGTVGRLKTIFPPNSTIKGCIVCFENTNFSWGVDWSKEYISSDRAQFYLEELSKLDSVNQIDKNHLVQMLERTKELFLLSYSNTDNSENKSNINELESQDFPK